MISVIVRELCSSPALLAQALDRMTLPNAEELLAVAPVAWR